MQVPGYQVIQELARTASAVVMLANSDALGKPVVVKVLAAKDAADPAARARFLVGVELQARLQHPNIAEVLDCASEGEQVFVATLYCRNGDLRERLEDGLQIRDLVSTIGDIARALDYLHEQGVVHRDVKPSNILFRDDGQAVLADFGIAIEAGAGPSVSAAGTVVGSPPYMSPEQAAGEPLDGRSDLYTLGVVLFELLTGAPPFGGGDAAAIALKQIQDPVPRLPAHLEALQPIIDKALAKVPDDRFPSGAAFVEALSAAVATTALGTLTLRSEPVNTEEIRAVGAAVLASARRAGERENRPRRLRDYPGVRAGGAMLALVLGIWWATALVERSETAARVLAVVGLMPDPAVEEAWDNARALHRDPNQSLATVVASYRRVLSLDPGFRRAQQSLGQLAAEWKSSIERALAQGNVTLASNRASEYLLVFPSDPELAELSQRISNRRTADNLVNSALAQLRTHGIGDPTAATLAIRSYQEVLRLVPEHPVAQTELDVLAQYYASRAAEAATAGEVDDAIGYLDRASTANKNLPLLAEIREQVLQSDPTGDTLSEILAEAARYRAAGALIDPPGANAAELYHRVLATDPSNARAAAGIEEVVAQLIASINEYLNAGDLVSAGELVGRASAIGLDQAAVAGTRTKLEQELERFNNVVRNLDDAAALFDRGLITEPPDRNAVLLLREVERLDPGNQTARALLVRSATRLAEAGQEAHELGMKSLGRTYLDLALSVTPDVPAWRELRARWNSDD